MKPVDGKKVKFAWSESCQRAFDKVRQELQEATGIYMPVRGAKYVLETDASLTGVGAALFQIVNERYRPVWFSSHKLYKQIGT